MNNEETFEIARKAYPGSKQGASREYNNFQLRSKKPVRDGMAFKVSEVITLLLPAIEYQKRYRAFCGKNNIWCPQWKNFQTWINSGAWETEYPDFVDEAEAPVDQPITKDDADKLFSGM